MLLSKNEWPLLLWGFIFLIISSAALLAYPHAIKNIIDDAIAKKDQHLLNMAALLALGIFLIQSITGALRYYFFTLAGERTVKRLRIRLFSQIIGQDMTFFDAHKSGELLGRLSSDTGVLQNSLSVNVSMFARSLAQTIGAIAMLFVTSFKLTAFILIIIPPLGILGARFGRRVKAISKKAQDSLATSSAVAEEGISGVRTVKAFTQETFEKNRYENKLDESLDISKSKIKEIARFTNLVTTVGLAAVVFIVWYGGTLVIQGELSVGTLTSFLLYVITVAFSVGMLGSLWTDFMSAIGASERIFELLEKAPENLDLGETFSGAGEIEFKDLTFSYPARAHFPILKGLSGKIKSHETVAIVGPSGSGKSTLAQLLMGFYELQSGSILIDQKDIKNISLKSLREAIGLVAQEPVLVSETILNNIKYARPDATDDEAIAASKKAYAHEFISEFPDGYQTLVGQRGVQLSGGQKQRVAIARAILKNPKILILDEATSALDSESEYLVQKALEEQLGERTTIIIAHRLSTVKRADKILVLQDGLIVQEGSHAELMKIENGLYHKLVEKQFETTKESTWHEPS